MPITIGKLLIAICLAVVLVPRLIAEERRPLSRKTDLIVTVYTVNSLGDESDAAPGNGLCATSGGVCTLRAAIEETNALAEPNGVSFSVTGTLTPASPYPPITDIFWILGDDDPGYTGVPLIIINGGGTIARGFDFAAGSDDSQLRGIQLYGFTDTAVSISSARVLLFGNYLGPVGGGTPNGDGVHLQATSSAAEIGSSHRNVISGNSRNGVRIEGSNHILRGNLIGTDVLGTGALPNGSDAVFMSGATGVVLGDPIGGPYSGVVNVISGNAGNGVTVSASTGNLIGGLIGMDLSVTMALPNGGDGIAFINGANDNAVGNDDGLTTIAGNTGNGISIDSSCAAISIGFSSIGAINDFDIQPPVPNGIHGISDSGTNTRIGFPFAGNLISDNTLDGIHLGATANGTTILGNNIGSNPIGARLPNGGHGISVGVAQGVTIGGTNLGDRNLITANTGDGINAAAASMLTIDNNIIGNQTYQPHEGNSGNGIHLQGTTSVTITRNEIDGNAGDGILVSGAAAGVSIIENSIDRNGLLGIDLGADGVTPNDPLDADSGPNGLQNFPLITSALTTATQTFVQGTINSTPNSTFTLHFYRSDVADPSGFGEGKTFIGSTGVTTNASGNAAFNFTGAAAQSPGVVTATATGTNGTSEFSSAVSLASAPAIQFSAAAYTTSESAVTATITVTRSGDLSATSTVNYAIADGTATQPADYSATSGMLTFAPGVSSQTFTVAIVDDVLVEPNETINLTLTAPTAATLGAQSSATLSIIDNDGTANLSITKTASTATFTPGQQVTFTIAVTNAGPNAASNVTVTDTLPAGMTFVSATSASFSCAGTTTITCTAAMLSNGATGTIDLAVTVNGATATANTATVTADQSDPSSINNAATAVLSPALAIPTLTESALLALLLAIAAIGAMKLR